MTQFNEESIETVCAAIANRRSLGLKRLQSDRPVERRLIERALAAADWAPSHGDTEPWRFTVYTGESRRVFGEAFADSYRFETPPESFKQNALEFQMERALSAPVWISIAVQPAFAPDGTLRASSQEEEVMAVACAVQNLHIVASASGLAGMWLSKSPFTDPHVARFVGLTAPARLLGFFILGYPTIDWPEGERQPLSTKVTWAEDH